MFRSRLIFAVAASTLVVPLSGQFGQAFLAAAVNKKQHADSLHKAEHELRQAQSALTGKNGGKQTGTVSQHLTNAISDLEHAVQHHKAAQGTQSNTGLGGALVKAANHKHQGHLQEALHAAKTAQNHLSAGNMGQATSEIAKAHLHVQAAIQSHHVLKTN